MFHNDGALGVSVCPFTMASVLPSEPRWCALREGVTPTPMTRFSSLRPCSQMPLLFHSSISLSRRRRRSEIARRRPLLLCSVRGAALDAPSSFGQSRSTLLQAKYELGKVVWLGGVHLPLRSELAGQPAGRAGHFWWWQPSSLPILRKRAAKHGSRPGCTNSSGRLSWAETRPEIHPVTRNCKSLVQLKF
ncbi:uncharacterized protein LOC121779892 [Salvia splendens]|uniref:uncharacterized protein LOC121779892 n=1 Tax=Salvia splendens TaxID=180675 RepID=UPI001C2572FE|nr:uncharacterized protein LOC121779892 [Salvia splendens]